MRRLQDQSGQAIALFAIALLLMGLITFFTIATGNRIQEKIKVQATADSAAYGLAVAQARSMNVMALANRAIVGEYVSALSVAGHISWMNNYEWTFKEQSELWKQLHDDVVADCATYTACHLVHGVPGLNPACAAMMRQCWPRPPFQCHYGNCLAIACTAKDLGLWSQIESGWMTTWSPASYTSIHGRWQGQPGAKIDVLRQVAADWVRQAYDARVQGQKAYREYYDLLDRGTFARGVASAMDPRMTEGRAVGAPNARLSMAGAKESLKSAIQVYPNNTGLTPDGTLIKNADFDVFNEILTGTRGSGIANLPGTNCSTAGAQENSDWRNGDYTCWQTRHGKGPGYFEDDSARTQSVCSSYNGAVSIGAARTIACPTSWDAPNSGGDPSPEQDPNQAPLSSVQGGAGSQMMMQGGFSTHDVVAVNQGNQHVYNDGDGLGMGGRTALSATDVDYTTAGFIIDPVGPPANNVGLSNPITGVCHVHTKERTDVYYQVSPDGALGCSRYTGPDGTVISRGNCNGDTEVGFFRFDIHDAYKASTKDPFDMVDLYNQPFTYASTQIDAVHPDPNRPNRMYPWEFEFGKVGGSMLKLDQKKDEHGDTRTEHRDNTRFTGGSEGYSSASYPFVRGFAAGLSYYHNPTSWAEVPNLFNPYWRAKLASPGAHALQSLESISPDDKEIGKELGYQ